MHALHIRKVCLSETRNPNIVDRVGFEPATTRLLLYPVEYCSCRAMYCNERNQQT